MKNLRRNNLSTHRLCCLILLLFCFGKVLGEFSGEVGFATIAQFSCYDISGEVPGEVSSKFSVFKCGLYFATIMVDFAPNETFFLPYWYIMEEKVGFRLK
jgi:hypothetical protein